MTDRARTARGGVLVGTVCLGLTAALTGCGGEDDPDEGTNGLGELSPATAEKKAKKAAQTASSVRVSGSVVTKAGTHRLEMRLSEKGGRGEVSTKDGPTLELLRIDKDLYLKADADFWARQEKSGKKPTEADVKAAGKLKGKYVKVPQGDPAYRQLSVFTNKRSLLDGLLAIDGARSADERGKVSGVETLRVMAGEEGKGGIIDVSLTGTPFPLRLERGGGAGTLELKDWNDKFKLSAPEKNEVVDYGKRISAD